MFNRNFRVVTAVGFAVLIGNMTAIADDASTSKTAAPVIIIKADDMNRSKATDGPVSPQWQAFVDATANKNIKVAIGIHGWSLKKDQAGYFDWLKDLQKKGYVEFFHHGFKHRLGQKDTPEFLGTSLDEQKHSLEGTLELAKKNLGVEIHTFGQHFSGTDENTVAALEACPQIEIWFFPPKKVKGSTKFILSRDCKYDRGEPTGLEEFQKYFTEKGASLKYIVIQGHPNQWKPEELKEFEKILVYLKEKGCPFMTPSEYAAACKKTTSGSN